MMQELKDAAARLKELKLGTWLEFIDKKSDRTLRGKLAWVNQHVPRYMFVNQSGRQIAVKSRDDLATAVVRGESRILPIEKTPFITRALNSIHRMLQNQSENGNSESELAKRVDDTAQPVLRG
jgi:Protein of unknown function (DUF1631)